ncbi:MAG: hypothetical protein LBF68_07055 [Christensenellaceae bacterium]|nr:hypothetical protein [Christensenellaceae bacterium]
MKHLYTSQKLTILIFAILLCIFTLLACTDTITKTYTKYDPELTEIFSLINGSKSYFASQNNERDDLTNTAYIVWGDNADIYEYNESNNYYHFEAFRNVSDTYYYFIFSDTDNNFYVINESNYTNQKNGALLYIKDFIKYLGESNLTFEKNPYTKYYMSSGTFVYAGQNRKLEFEIDLDTENYIIGLDVKLTYTPINGTSIVEIEGEWVFSHLTSEVKIPYTTEEMQQWHEEIDKFYDGKYYTKVDDLTTTYESIAIDINGDPFQITFSFDPVVPSDDRVDIQLIGTNYEDYVSLDGLTLTPIATTPENSDIKLRIVSIDNPEAYVEIPVEVISNYTLAPKNGDLSLLNQFCTDSIPFTPFTMSVTGNISNASFVWKINDSLLSDNTTSELLIDDSIFDDYIKAGANTIFVSITKGTIVKNYTQTLIIADTVAPFSLRILNPTPYYTDDVIQVQSTVDTENVEYYYLPSVYKWILFKDNIIIEEEIINAQFVDNVPIGSIFTFTLDSSYYVYTIECIPVIDNTPDTAYKKTIQIDEISEPVNSGIYKTYVDGIDTANGYQPIIKYNTTGINSTYRIKIIKDNADYVFASTNPAHSSYFNGYGFIIPDSVASFGDTFSYYVSSNEGKSMGPYQYNATLKDIPKSYFDTIQFDFNGYIADLEEFGNLYNYLLLFQPQSYISNQQGSIFTIQLYFSFTYDDIKNDLLNSINESTNNDPYLANAENLFKAMMNTYAEPSAVQYETYLVSGHSNIYKFNINFDSDLSLEDSFTTDFDSELTLVDSIMNVSLVGTRSTLPIDSVQHTMNATTADQLFFILMNGYRPTPVSGSKAFETYTIARNILTTYVRDTMTNAEKIVAIYDVLSNHFSYDNILLKISDDPDYADIIEYYDGFTAYGALVNNKAVCDGMAKAFSILLAMEGIESIKVSGFTTENHAWNAILLDHEWYLADITFGNLSFTADQFEYEVIDHNQLLRSLSDFQDSHFPDQKYPPIASDSYEITYQVFLDDQTSLSSNFVLLTTADVQNAYDYYIGYLNCLESQPDLLVMDFYIESSSIFNSLRNTFYRNIPNGYTIAIYTLTSNPNSVYVLLKKNDQ